MTTRALVIGCGGTIGGAWIVAALAALADQIGWDPHEAEILQGTSAGAEIVTMLGSGIDVNELVAMELGAATDPRLRQHYASAPPGVPPLPSPRPLAPGLARIRQGHLPFAAFAPTGRGNPAWLHRLADGLTAGRAWFSNPVRMVAVDTRTGRRVVFGAPGAPVVSPATALLASWAVPGWLPPVAAAGTAYIDGGAASTASVDLLPAGLDEIYVVAPMASPTGDRIPGIGGLLEDRLLRRRMTGVLAAEIEDVTARGSRVITICPDHRDLAGLPWNFMNRAERAAAFASAMRTAPGTVATALARG